MPTLAAILLDFLMALSPIGIPVCDSVPEKANDTISADTVVLRSEPISMPNIEMTASNFSAPTLHTTAAEIYYFHPDHLGSSAWITDSTGVAVQHLCYLPWGENWITQKNLQANLMFISITEMLLIVMEHGGITTKNMCLQIKKENF